MYLNILCICFPIEVLHQVILERSWTVVEVAGAGKEREKLNQSFGKIHFQN